MDNTWKWRTILGVIGFLPPLGGAAQVIILQFCMRIGLWLSRS